MPTMSWNEVVAIHNAQCGISTKGGKVRSVLCNQAKEGYADEVRSDAIFYRVTSSTNQTSVVALRGMAGLNETIRVFEKLGVNQWIDHGVWFVHDCAPEEGGEIFHFTKTRL
jgi:hypothetical protein